MCQGAVSIFSCRIPNSATALNRITIIVIMIISITIVVVIITIIISSSSSSSSSGSSVADWHILVISQLLRHLPDQQALLTGHEPLYKQAV
jgi:hypothetical protein